MKYLWIWTLLVATLWVGSQILRDYVFVAAEPRIVTPRGALAAFERQNVDVFERLAPSVAYIFTRTDDGLFGPAATPGAGSGFIWDRAGHVVTNFHVVDGASEVLVRLDSGDAILATVVGAAPDYDLAVLTLGSRPAGLRPIPVGTSSDLKVGQTVLAIGNPFGLSRSLTTGVISALDRHLPTGTGRKITGVIQTDAAINPGNSGGPLLDSAGRLIGVNTVIISGVGGSAGVGFAVPVDVVNRIVPQIIAKSSGARPGIGITAAPRGAAARAGIEGLIVVDVLPGGSAAQAGLRGMDRQSGDFGDIISHVNGHPVKSIAELAAELDRVGIGNQAELTVRRGARTLSVRVTVADIS